MEQRLFQQVQNGSNVPPGAHDVSVNPGFGSGNMLAYYPPQLTSPIYKAGSLSWAPPKDIDGDARVLCASMGADQVGCSRAFLPLIER